VWEIKREDLLAGLQILDMVPEKLGIPSSEFFWVRGKGSDIRLSVASYISGEVVIKGKGTWPISKDFFIDRRVFLPFVYAAREIKQKALFQFEKKGKQLVVRHGSRKSLFDSQSRVRGYSDLRRLKKHSATTFPADNDLRELLLCGKNCAVSDSIQPHLNCVYIAKGSKGLSVRALASNDKVYYLGKGALEDGRMKTEIPFPLFLINLLAVKGVKRISWRGKFIVLSFKNGWLWQPISEEAYDQFPEKKISRYSLRSESMPVTFVASSRRFSRLMTRLGYYLQSVRRKDWVVKLRGKQGAKSILASTNIPGAGFVEKIGTTEYLKKDFKIEWPLDILEPVFDFLSKKTKKLGVVVRIDSKRGVTYVQAGNFWLAITSQQEK